MFSELCNLACMPWTGNEGPSERASEHYELKVIIIYKAKNLTGRSRHIFL